MIRRRWWMVLVLVLIVTLCAPAMAGRRDRDKDAHFGGPLPENYQHLVKDYFIERSPTAAESPFTFAPPKLGKIRTRPAPLTKMHTYYGHIICGSVRLPDIYGVTRTYRFAALLHDGTMQVILVEHHSSPILLGKTCTAPPMVDPRAAKEN